MKVLSKDYKQKLKDLKLEEYFKKCVEDLIEINYENPYPKDKSLYLKFVKHVYKEAQKYDIADVQETFSLMLVWHVKGEKFSKDKNIHKYLMDESIDMYTKYEILINMAFDEMDEYELKKKLKDEDV